MEFSWLTRFTLALTLTQGCTARTATETQCMFNSDCSGTLVCNSGFCRTACRESKDCSPGYFCLPASNPAETLCANETSAPFCNTTTPCDQGWTCNRHGQCTLPCTTNDDCIPYSTESQCGSDGTCVIPALEARYATTDGGVSLQLSLAITSMPTTLDSRLGERVGGTGEFRVRVTDLLRSNAPASRRIVRATVTSGVSVFPAEVMTNLQGEAIFTVRARLVAGEYSVRFATDGAMPVEVKPNAVSVAAGLAYSICNADPSLATKLPGALTTATLGTLVDTAAEPLLGGLYLLTNTALVRMQLSGFASVIAGSLDGSSNAFCRAGDHGPATTACLQNARAMALRVGSPGVYLAEGNPTTVIRRIDSVSETIDTVAGGGTTIPSMGTSTPARDIDLGTVETIAAGEGGSVGVISLYGTTWKMLRYDPATAMVSVVGESQSSCTVENAWMGCATSGCDAVLRPGGQIVVSGQFCNTRAMGGPRVDTRVVSSTSLAPSVSTVLLGGGDDATNAATPATIRLSGRVSIALRQDSGLLYVLEQLPLSVARIWSLQGTTFTRLAGNDLTSMTAPPRATDYTPAASSLLNEPSQIFVRGTGFGWIEKISETESSVRVVP